mgnify:CR=1 FL=1
MSERSVLNVGISMGDPNGIGPEVIIKTLRNETVLKYCTPVIYGNPKVFIFYAKGMKDTFFKFNQIENASDAKPGVINMVATGDKEFLVEIGKPTEQAGKEAFNALEAMTKDALANKIQALVTAPLDKSTVEKNAPSFTGHTGYLAEEFGVDDYMMLLTEENLKVGLVTEHLAISEVAAQVSQEKIEKKLRVLIETLKQDFSITKPKIAVLGLNPHNGDNGIMGVEEKEMIYPAIKTLKDEGNLVFGPFPADGFFGGRMHVKYDAVLAMYHDQGLVPFKYIAFDDGINFTAGLPLVRTSPDHGTAYDVAGKGEARITSFMNALFEAIHICYTRNENQGLEADFLPFSELRQERFKMNFSL